MLVYYIDGKIWSDLGKNGIDFGHMNLVNEYENDLIDLQMNFAYRRVWCDGQIYVQFYKAKNLSLFMLIIWRENLILWITLFLIVDKSEVWLAGL